MSETTKPDYVGMAHEEIAELDGKRGLVAVQLSSCGHPERAAIDRALSRGQSPRNLARRYSPGLSRKALRRHRDGCLAGTGGGG